MLPCNHANLLTCPYAHVNAGKSAHTVHAPVYDPTFRIRSSGEAHWWINPMEVLSPPQDRIKDAIEIEYVGEFEASYMLKLYVCMKRRQSIFRELIL
jgi:hypothetical protein